MSCINIFIPKIAILLHLCNYHRSLNFLCVYNTVLYYYKPSIQCHNKFVGVILSHRSIQCHACCSSCTVMCVHIMCCDCIPGSSYFFETSNIHPVRVIVKLNLAESHGNQSVILQNFSTVHVFTFKLCH